MQVNRSLLMSLLLASACVANNADVNKETLAQGDSDSSGSEDGSGDVSDGGYEWKLDLASEQDAGDEAEQASEDVDPNARDVLSEEVGCIADTPSKLTLSPGDANSMSVPVRVRDAVLNGWSLLSMISLPSWEFFNFYGFPYAPAVDGDPRVAVELVRTGDGDEEYVVQIGVVGPTLTNDARSDVSLTVVVDTSASMQGTPFELVRASYRSMAGNLRLGDRVSLVTWNAKNRIVLDDYQVIGPNDPLLLATLDSLMPDGSTDFSGALDAAYDVASRSYDPARLNRVVVFSDGGSGAGQDQLDRVSAAAQGASEVGVEGVLLVGVGVGTTQVYQPGPVELLGDVGMGGSLFVATMDDAQRMLGEHFLATFVIGARDVSIELELPPGFVVMGGMRSTTQEPFPPQPLAVNDTMVVHETIRTCAASALTEDSKLLVRLHYAEASTLVVRTVVHEAKFVDLLAAPSVWLHKGRAIRAYVDALRTYRHPRDPDERVSAVTRALQLLEVAEHYLTDDRELEDIRAVLERL